MILQFAATRPSHKIEGEHFKGSFCWLPAGPQSDEHTCNQGTVDLDGQPIEGLSQKMLAANHTLEPPEE